MGNEYLDTSLLDKAIIFAVNAHKNQERRAKGTPYVVHVLEAVAIAETLTKDQEVMAAAALHDTVEDSNISPEEIEKEFGPRIRKYVEMETALIPEGKTEEETWRERKQLSIDNIKKGDKDAQIVAMGDKLSNMRAIHRDYLMIGDELWLRFHEHRKSEHEWHYRNLLASFDKLEGTAAYAEFLTLLNMVFPK